MASTFMLKSGCYQTVYQISWALQQFITNVWLGVGLCVIQMNNIMLNRK